MKRGRWAGWAALALAACGGEPSGEGTGAERDLVTDLDPNGEQNAAAWQACGGRIECRSIEVPLDHADPDGATIELALARAPHWEGYDLRGVIVVNPGGPGAPGRPFLEALDARRAVGLLRGFDLVSFDPRGTGDSGAVLCGGDTVLKDVFESRGTVGLISVYESDAADCAQRMGPLFDHLGSQDVVRDMDLIRAALGQDQLNFLGGSYGTRLAALYASVYPERVRAFVLDGPVRPVADLAELVDDQFEALLAAVSEVLGDCASGALDCPPDARTVFDDLWNQSVARGAEDIFVGVCQQLLSSPDGRESLAGLLYEFWLFPELWDDIVLSIFADHTPADVAVNQTVHCSDQSVPNPAPDTISAALAAYAERSPELWPMTLTLATCAGWHVAPNPVPPLAAPGAPPMLLIGGEHDILTPFPFAEQMHAALTGSVLVRSGHHGHGAVLVGLPCIDAMLESFYTTLELPADGASCP
ncbi:MAG TPA: alpha/beta fold hydrolase [Polyangiaceae bacterium]|jgi:pimeloyl-ACP methyl ester carboxylesterase|nr:alpha/beta fold hydrolase [Polyangiaceae bacterium]